MTASRDLIKHIETMIMFQGIHFKYESLSLSDKCLLKSYWFKYTEEIDMKFICTDYGKLHSSIIDLLQLNSETNRNAVIEHLLESLADEDIRLDQFIDQVKYNYEQEHFYE